MTLQIVPQWVSTPNTLTLTTILLLFVTLIVVAWTKRRKYIERVNNVPGPGNGGYTVLGDAIEVFFCFVLQILIFSTV